jgi:glycosyltransferase involved in cell wall biosynthesis
MGVLFISSAEQPGADTFIHMLLMRMLDRRRFDVHVACSAGPPGARTRGYQALTEIPNLRLRETDFGPSLSDRSRFAKLLQLPKLGAMFWSLWALARYVRSNGIRILHSTDRPRDAFACAVVGRLSGAKSIVHAHLKCADWMSPSLRRSMAQADALMAISAFVGQSLIDCGYARDKTHVVLNAIDLSRWDYRLDPGSVRRELGIPLTAPVIASASRLFRAKGQAELVRALPQLREAFPDLRLLIVGRDDFQVMTTSFTAELKALAADLGVAEHLIFAGQRSDMPAVMAACDVFALPSDEEPFGLVFVEAMAMKRPVVALANGGTLEIVEHGKSGLLSPRGDVDTLAANLRTLLGDPALRARMGEYGRQQAEARFSAGRMAADAARVYTLLTPDWHSDAAENDYTLPARRSSTSR